jgi:alpha-D-xyloside xylohydrolase
MKFRDGNWLLREGVEVWHAGEAYDAADDGKSLVIAASCRHIRHRGDTIGGTLLTVRASAPMPDVIRIAASRHAGVGDLGPEYDFEDNGGLHASSCTRCERYSLQSGRLRVEFARKPGWGVTFLGDERILTSSGGRGLGYARVGGKSAYMMEQLSLGVGECVYGLGERFTSLVKNGQVVDIWNKDGGTSSEQAYKNIPFYLTDRGYGVFVNDPGAVSFEVASETVSKVQFSVPGERLEYFVIYGPTPKEILEKYTALMGRPALPPAWSFGLWLTTSFTTSYDEATITSFIDGMAQRDLPLHVFHFDCFWMRAYRWCDFEWDRDVFPDPVAMLARLKERGLKICVWINPYIAQLSPLFDEGREQGYLLQRADGKGVWQTDDWQPGLAIVDFTNPNARVWYAGKLEALLDMGVDCFKTDFGERIPTDVVYHDGSDSVKMHNYYTYLYNETVFNLLKEKRGEGDAVLFARSATAGGQKFPVHWGGDCNSTYESMAESLRGGLSLGMSGFGYWSHDIGGFEGMPPADLYKRWIAFGLLSSHSRLHGSSSYRVPWLFDEEAVEVLRHFTKLKCRLMPYLYEKAREASQTGVPMMRAMLLEFPDDPNCRYLDTQYMLGESLLVAPVFAESGLARFYLPEGSWTEFATGRTLSGGRWVEEYHDFLSIPLYVRENSIIPMGARDDRPDYDFADGVTYHIFGLSDGSTASAHVPTLSGGQGPSISVQREANRIEIEAKSLTGKAWSFILVGIAASSISEAIGGSVVGDDLGALIEPQPGVENVQLWLRLSPEAAYASSPNGSAAGNLV